MLSMWYVRVNVLADVCVYGDTARWLLAVSVLAEGCRENQDRLMELGAAETAIKVRGI